MRWRSTLSFMAAAAIPLAVTAQRQHEQDVDFRSYSPAFYSMGAASMGEQKLMIFPADREVIDIPLPFPLAGYSPTIPSNSKALFTKRLPIYSSPTDQRAGAGLYKIDFNPTRASVLPGVQELKTYGVGIFVVSFREDKIVFSGEHMDGSSLRCGIFEMELPDGAVKPVIQEPECAHRWVTDWVSLSLSPNGDQVVVVHRGRLERIDLASAGIAVLGDGFLKASWSPDGSWIAAVKNGGKYETVLIDPSNPSRIRTLGSAEPSWSPDSRYLLRINPRGCGSELGTLEALNIDTKKTTTIKSSRCEIYTPAVGWVSNSIIPQASVRRPAGPGT